MQEILIEFALVLFLSFIIGLGSSMVGVSGGVFKTPVLIIIIGLSAQFSIAISLFSALFVAIPSTIKYFRNEKKPTQIRIGMVAALLSVPGLFIGVLLKSMISEDYILRLIFGVSLFPVALMMLLTKRSPERTDSLCEITEYDISSISSMRLVIAGIGFFVTGIAASMLGLGGGVLYVPTMCLILDMPMLSAAATSVFIMLFTSTTGTIMNLAIIPQTATFEMFIFYTTALGVGLVLGAIIGASYACKVDSIILKRFFGVTLTFPLIHLMNLGQLWLDPLGTSYLTCTIGDILLWILVVLPCTVVWVYWHRNKAVDYEAEVKTKGS
jgi:uncharacterized protein